MTREEKIALNEQNIRTALEDYRRNTCDTDVLDDVSDRFIRRLAADNYDAKAELRELFRKSPVWNESLDAIVINGNRTHDTDYSLVYRLVWKMLRSVGIDYEKYEKLEKAVELFTNPDPTEEERAKYIEALNEIAPKAYAPGKKLSRVFKSLCDALGVTDESKGSDFQKLYAQFADELSAKQIGYKLYVSLNPAHFITMSNPVCDRRGNTLTSCHSFNRTDYSYNNGCTGYARDKYTFIAFTAADPAIPETLNNRKTSRQIFCYKPGNGLLLQSRLYNTNGGTTGAQALSKDYRDLIQREISAIEESPNLWRTFKYCGNKEGVAFDEGEGFGGYADWTYSDFDAKVSVRADHAEDYETWDIGTYGICVKCGCDTSDGVYCDDCSDEGKSYCEDCDDRVDEDDLYTVYGTDGYERQVCEDCRERYYTYCYECETWHHNDSVHYVESIDDYVCEDCLDRYYEYCEECGNYYRSCDGKMNDATDKWGNEVLVCDDCLDRHYIQCDDCGEYFHEDYIERAGEDTYLCPDCLEARRAEENENEETEVSAA